jgi:hypothetical protein
MVKPLFRLIPLYNNFLKRIVCQNFEINTVTMKWATTNESVVAFVYLVQRGADQPPFRPSIDKKKKVKEQRKFTS